MQGSGQRQRTPVLKVLLASAQATRSTGIVERER
jgi:hypothetical protein